MTIFISLMIFDIDDEDDKEGEEDIGEYEEIDK